MLSAVVFCFIPRIGSFLVHPECMESAQLGEDNLEQVLPESSCTSELSPEQCRALRAAVILGCVQVLLSLSLLICSPNTLLYVSYHSFFGQLSQHMLPARK